jgi:hypothetical protein
VKRRDLNLGAPSGNVKAFEFARETVLLAALHVVQTPVKKAKRQ